MRFSTISWNSAVVIRNGIAAASKCHLRKFHRLLAMAIPNAFPCPMIELGGSELQRIGFILCDFRCVYLCYEWDPIMKRHSFNLQWYYVDVWVSPLAISNAFLCSRVELCGKGTQQLHPLEISGWLLWAWIEFQLISNAFLCSRVDLCGNGPQLFHSLEISGGLICSWIEFCGCEPPGFVLWWFKMGFLLTDWTLIQQFASLWRMDLRITFIYHSWSKRYKESYPQ